MKRFIVFGALVLTASSSWGADNQIYIQQTTTSTNSQIDLEQLGSGNIIAKNAAATTAMKLNGSNLTFDLNQIGDTNKFLSDINASSSTFNINWTGDSNTFTGLFNSAGTYDIDNMTFTNTILGGNNAITASIGEGADANDASIDWYLNGSDNAITANIAGGAAATNATIDWDINGSDNTIGLNVATTATHSTEGSITAADSSYLNLDWDITGSDNTATVIAQSKYVTQDWDITGSNNTIDYIGTGNSGASSGNGHNSTISLTGNYWEAEIQQRSASNNDVINFSATGSGTSGSPATLCIIQNDSGTSTSC